MDLIAINTLDTRRLVGRTAGQQSQAIALLKELQESCWQQAMNRLQQNGLCSSVSIAYPVLVGMLR